MKKQLIAMALATAFSVPALAQQATVYGIIDQAYRATSPDVGAGTQGVVSGSFATSRLGVRGTEDLGGGITASFTLEGGVNAGTGAVGSGSNLFSRESSVTLAGGFGAVTVGRTDTSASEGIDTLAGIANFGYFAFVSGVEYAGDRENTVRYTTPKIAGFTAQIGESAAGTQGSRLRSGSVTFAQGNLSLGVGYDETREGNTYTAAGGRYDFGYAAVGAMAGQRDAAGVKTDVQAYTARVPLPAGLAALGSYRITEVGTTKTTVAAAGISKALSKRTQIVAVYKDTDKGAAAGSFAQVGLVHSF